MSASRRSAGMRGTWVLSLALVASLGAVSACGSDNRAAPSDANSEQADGGGAGADSGGEPAPVYLVSTCIYSPDSSNGYVVAVDSLDGGDEPDLSRALEIPGCGVLSGPERGGVFFTGENESATIRRYRFRDGGFTEDGSFSLQGLGITDSAFQQGQFVYLSDTKAYIVSGKGAPELIVWNPAAMEIVKTVPIEGLERDGVYPAFGYTAHVIGGSLYVSARWRGDDAFRQENALVVVDTATDAVVSVSTDERCADLLYSVADEQGDLYFSNGPYATAFRLAVGEASAPPPCVLRVRAGETRFDPDFQRSLADLVGGREASSLTRGPDGTAFIQVFHEDESPVAPGTEWYELFDAAGWRWWRVDLDFEAAEEVSSLSLGAAAFDPFPVDGKTYQTLPKEFYTETDFLNMSAAAGIPMLGGAIPGYVTGVLRVQ